jgi:hypothetical protein
MPRQAIRKLVATAISALNTLPEAIRDELESDPDIDCMIGRYYNNDDLEPYRETAIATLENANGLATIGFSQR